MNDVSMLRRMIQKVDEKAQGTWIRDSTKKVGQPRQAQGHALAEAATWQRHSFGFNGASSGGMVQGLARFFLAELASVFLGNFR